MLPALVVQTPGDRFGRSLADRARGTANLEGADRLQALELQPDFRLRHVDMKPDERRADCVAGDHAAG